MDWNSSISPALKLVGANLRNNNTYQINLLVISMLQSTQVDLGSEIYNVTWLFE